MRYAWKQVNAMSVEAFIHAFGPLYEHSPWVAERAAGSRPFLTIDEMVGALEQEVWRADPEEQLALLRSHPDLGTRVRMTEHSVQEQAGAGLQQLTSEEYEQFMTLNKHYTEAFQFPFIMAVKGQHKDAIREALRRRLQGTPEAELQTALQEVCKIGRFRLADLVRNETEEIAMEQAKGAERIMYYGKGDVWVYRSYAKPLTNISLIPESGFTGRDNVLFGMNIKIAVSGEKLFTSFSEGDNSRVVATDSMKNFILRKAGEYEGATAEGFLAFASRHFLEKYPWMTGIKMSADQVAFEVLQVPGEKGLQPGELVYRYSQNEHPTAAVELIRNADDQILLVDHSAGIADLKLIKVKGSSFAGFVRDEYTTLPESQDRPLFIFLDIAWSYESAEDAWDCDLGRYVAAEQIRDIAHTVFHEQHSPSIQNLIYRIGQRALQRFPQLKDIRFESNNRTWETILEDVAVGEGKVFTEPRPPYGFQGFSMTKQDLEGL
ncbi:factor-independent urate hydroxylase [Paenibacillus roseipurpureus]|uniref:Urate oxidase n=1 Tax=Paenibacillus roseopurpureus TaxID=2918901 RepID=A0AA96LQ22_9BACL|nr:urate oxidase [Paenibacillus sp. MBLB1832]WNR45059.1 urate oxidase [Paenibacillus sp. MBLB1832]